MISLYEIKSFKKIAFSLYCTLTAKKDVQHRLHLHKCNSCCIFPKYVPNNFYAQDLITKILYGFLKNVRNVAYHGLLANWHLRMKVCPFVAPYARIIELGFRLHMHSIHSMQCANHNQER